MENERIAGAAVSTPLNSNLTIDQSLLVSHGKNLLSCGIDLLTFFGTTGEGASFSISERNRVIQLCSEEGISPTQLGSGIFGLTSKDTGADAAAAFSNGCGHVLLAPPLFYKGVDDEGLYRWFSEVIEAVGSNIRSVILYHIPALTQIELSVELVLRLSEAFPGVVVAVKDSSGNWSHTERLIKKRGLLRILVGHEGQLERAMRMGASGAIAGTANILPDIIHSIVHKESQQPSLPLLIDELVRYPIVAGVKALISHRMGSASWLQVKPPLTSIAPEKFRVLSERLDSLFPL